MASNADSPTSSHNCERSMEWPKTEAGKTGRLQVYGYHAEQLLAQSARVRYDEPTDTQLWGKHCLLSEYLQVNPETDSYEAVYAFLQVSLAGLDHYFFSGALTRRTKSPPLVTLRLNECPPYLLPGMTGETTYQLTPPYIVIRMFRSARGGHRGYHRYSKAALLQTLLHELTHAYIQTFYCRCATDPAGHPTTLVDGLDGTGHGDLFAAVLRHAQATIRTWHPELALLRDPELDPGLGHAHAPPAGAKRPLAHRLEDWYLGAVTAAPGIGRALWLEWHQPLPPPASDGGDKRRHNQQMLRRGLLRLAFPTYMDFVRSRVMDWREVAVPAAAGLVALLAVTVLMAIFRGLSLRRAGMGGRSSEVEPQELAELEGRLGKYVVDDKGLVRVR